MYIEALFGDVDLAIGEPSVEVEVIVTEGGLGEGVPLDPVGLFAPVGEGVEQGSIEG